MEAELLDDDFILKDNKEPEPSIYNWLAIIILWIGMGLNLKNGLITDVQVIIAGALLIAASILTFKNFKLGVKLTFFIILIGIFSFVDFFPNKYELIIGIIKFELILLLIGIIHYFSNKKLLKPYLKNLIYSPATEEEKQKDNDSRVKGFKTRFSDRSNDELEGIISNKLLVQEAIQAAREILEERQVENG